ncbi:hypothetical protein AB0C12_33185 [Actinoplanes sp. NPDC048967]|uniref:hypothetical protein n=1 Tax=Actinoplanes sp. NPDC048967 TaxID=3155269 RepID=UPI00340747FC
MKGLDSWADQVGITMLAPIIKAAGGDLVRTFVVRCRVDRTQLVQRGLDRTQLVLRHLARPIVERPQLVVGRLDTGALEMTRATGHRGRTRRRRRSWMAILLA